MMHMDASSPSNCTADWYCGHTPSHRRQHLTVHAFDNTVHNHEGTGMLQTEMELSLIAIGMSQRVLRHSLGNKLLLELQLATRLLTTLL